MRMKLLLKGTYRDPRGQRFHITEIKGKFAYVNQEGTITIPMPLTALAGASLTRVTDTQENKDDPR